jgi:hypothetical protein
VCRSRQRRRLYLSLGSHPRIQILTIAEMLEGKKIDMLQVGRSNVTYKKAARHVKVSKQDTFIDMELKKSEDNIPDGEY